MKSKSFNKEQYIMEQVKNQNIMDQVKENKSFEFVKLYKSAAETKVVPSETTKWSKKVKKTNKSELNTRIWSRSVNKSTKKKINETLNLSNIDAIESNPSEATRSSRKSSLTSTPININESSDNGVKSIMKNKPVVVDSLLSVSNVSTPSSKPKKRNKSVSFMLDDAEEIVVKKSKSNDSGKEHKNQAKGIGSKVKSADIKTRKQKKILQSNENQNLNDEVVADTLKKEKLKEPTLDVPGTEEPTAGSKKKVKRAKKSKLRSEEAIEISEDNITEEQSSENKIKKSKKKKRKAKSIQEDNTEVDGEPAIKTRKRDLKPETIAKGLENLNIGDNAHTLTNLLDEMTVVDKNKKKRDKQKKKKSNNSETKQEKALQKDSISEAEKLKWNNRKWNKDTKGDSKLRLLTSVVVDNLPIKIMCSYKTLLSEHFGKFGTIEGIGVAEAYPTEDPKPVFTTTIFFQEEQAATKALEEDNSLIEGSRVRVRRPLPPAETTVVVRAYSLSDQALSSLFSGAGRIRAIRQLIKGKKTMPTAFVEFDGSEAVERALKLSEGAKINGKKMYVSKYENRKKGKSMRTENKCDGEDNGSSGE